MPINWNLLDTQYPQKLGALFDPSVVAEKQNRLSDLAAQRDMRNMQMVQGVDQLNKTRQIQGILQQTGGDPEKAVQALLAAGHTAEAAQLKALMPKPEKVPDWKDPEWMMAQRELAKVRGGAQRSPMAPVAYVDPSTGKTVWGTITEAKGKQAANFSPMVQSEISGAKAAGSERGKAEGEAMVKLEDMQAMIPRLEVVTAELSELGKKATYTKVGQVSDTVRRQLGLGVGEGAIARKEYISKVDNEILPLLRQTFGAQFTQKEGESLKATLGDPDASPEEKDAVLKSFIQTKYGQIAGLQRRINPNQSENAQSGSGIDALLEKYK